MNATPSCPRKCDWGIECIGIWTSRVVNTTLACISSAASLSQEKCAHRKTPPLSSQWSPSSERVLAGPHVSGHERGRGPQGQRAGRGRHPGAWHAALGPQAGCLVWTPPPPQALPPAAPPSRCTPGACPLPRRWSHVAHAWGVAPRRRHAAGAGGVQAHALDADAAKLCCRCVSDSRVWSLSPARVA